jgi:hypothetical protein
MIYSWKCQEGNGSDVTIHDSKQCPNEIQNGLIQRENSITAYQNAKQVCFHWTVSICVLNCHQCCL